MSKNKWKSILLMIVMLICMWSMNASAKDATPYSISDYSAYVTIHSDGSVFFDEYITYRLNEAEVLTQKPINMAGASEMLDLEVFYLDTASADIEDTESLISVPIGSDTGEQDEGTYRLSTASEMDELYHITIPIIGDKKQTATYVYRYTLKDLIFMYKDTAAFFWQFVSIDSDITVDHIEATITTPEAEGHEDVLTGFQRGAIYGSKSLLSDNLFWVGADNMTTDEYLEVTILMPTALIPEGRKIIDNFARETIMNELTAWEDDADRIRLEDQFRFKSSWTLTALTGMLMLGAGIFLFLKMGRRTKLKTRDADMITLPDGGLSPAELSALYRNGTIGKEALFATLLHLVHIGCLGFHKAGEKTILIYMDGFNKALLKPHEEYLLDWLIKDLGNSQMVSIEEVDRLFTQPKTVNRFQYKLATWAKLAQPKQSKPQPQSNIAIAKVVGFIIVGIGLLSAYMAGIMLGNQPAGIIAFVLSLGLGLFTLTIKKSDFSGSLQSTQWALFRDFLRKQLQDKSTELPTSRWEQYIIYALPLNMAFEVFYGITEIYPSQVFEDGNLTFLYRSNHEWMRSMLNHFHPGPRRKK